MVEKQAQLQAEGRMSVVAVAAAAAVVAVVEKVSAVAVEFVAEVFW